MAPRGGRTRKVGLRRIDAALDAMRPMGFPEDLVRKNVGDLLKVYGGDEGWRFIEENCYKLLIETILEGEEEPEKEDTEPKLIENTSLKDGILDEPGVQVHFPDVHSREVHSLHNYSLPPKDIVEHSLKDVHSREVHSLHNHSLPPKDIVEHSSKDVHSREVHSLHNHSLPPKDIVEHSSKDAHSMQVQSEQHHSLLLEDVVEHSLKDPHSMQVQIVQSPRVCSPPSVDSVPTRRHKPCYGWISSDDEEDLVYFTPAT